MNVAENKGEHKLFKNIRFVIEALKNIKSTGTVWPSSPYLVRKMIAPIDFKKADCIIEFGVGDGVITRALLEQMKPESKLLGFEINPSFYKQQVEELQDQKLTLINDSAEKAEVYVKKAGFLKVPYVVSGLPLANLDKILCKEILGQTHGILEKNGKFIQFQYSLSEYKLLKKYFRRVRIKVALLNFPPAVVYICTK